MKTLTVVTSAEATVTESWLLGVPDDFDVEAFDSDNDMFAAAQEAGEILDVKNLEVGNEHDREVYEVRTEQQS